MWKGLIDGLTEAVQRFQGPGYYERLRTYKENKESIHTKQVPAVPRGPATLAPDFSVHARGGGGRRLSWICCARSRTTAASTTWAPTA